MTDYVKNVDSIVAGAFDSQRQQEAAVSRTLQTQQASIRANQRTIAEREANDIRRQEIDRRSELMRRQDMEDANTSRAARRHLAVLSKQIGDADDIPDKAEGVLTRIVRTNELMSIYNPNTPGINPTERAARSMIKSKLPDAGQKLIDNIAHEYSTVPFTIEGLSEPRTLQDIQSLLAAPGREGDAVREFLGRGDPAKLEQLVNSPGIMGKVQMFRDPDTGGPLLLTSQQGAEFLEMEAAKVGFKKNLFLQTGIDPRTEAGQRFVEEQFQMADQRARAKLGLIKQNREYLKTRDETLKDTILEGTTMAPDGAGGQTQQGTGKAIGVLSYDPYVLRSEPEIARTMTGVEGMTDNEAKSLALGVLRAGKVSAAFVPTVSYYEGQGDSPLVARRKAYDEVQSLSKIETDFNRLKATGKNGALLTIEPLLDSGLSAFQVQNRINLLRGAKGGTARVALSEVIYADASQGIGSNPENDLAQMAKLEQAAGVRMSLRTVPVDDIVSMSTEELTTVNQYLGGRPVPGNVWRMVTRMAGEGATVRTRAASILALSRSRNLNDFSALLASKGDSLPQAVDDDVQRAIASAQFETLQSSAIQGAVGAFTTLSAQVGVESVIFRETEEGRKESGKEIANYRVTPPAPSSEAVPPSSLESPDAAPASQEPYLKSEEVPTGSSSKTTTGTLEKVREFGVQPQVPTQLTRQVLAQSAPLLKELSELGNFTPQQAVAEFQNILASKVLSGVKDPKEYARRSALVSEATRALAARAAPFQRGEVLNDVVGNVLDLAQGRKEPTLGMREAGISFSIQKGTEGEDGTPGKSLAVVTLMPGSVFLQDSEMLRAIKDVGVTDPETGAVTISSDSINGLEGFFGQLQSSVITRTEGLRRAGAVPFRSLSQDGAPPKNQAKEIVLRSARNLMGTGQTFSMGYLEGSSSPETYGGVEGSPTFQGEAEGYGGILLDPQISPVAPGLEGNEESGSPFWEWVRRKVTPGSKQTAFVEFRNEMDMAIDDRDDERVLELLSPAYRYLSELKKEAVTAGRATTKRHPDAKMRVLRDGLQDPRIASVLSSVNPELFETLSAVKMQTGEDIFSYSPEALRNLVTEIDQSFMNFVESAPGIAQTVEGQDQGRAREDRRAQEQYNILRSLDELSKDQKEQKKELETFFKENGVIAPAEDGTKIVFTRTKK